MLTAVAHHLWQSTLFAAAAALATFALRRRPARVRHAIWLAASMKFLVPFSLLVGIGHRAAPAHPRAILSPAIAVAIDDVANAMSFGLSPTPAPSHTSDAIVWIWVCGFGALTLRSVLEWRRARATVRAALPFDLALPIEARVCSAPIEPGVFGILRPVLLLPEGIADRLPPAELRALVAHELCHIRHRDNLAARAHSAVEAIFWFHPLVWWVGARLVEERERACDEEVLRLGNAPDVYAGSILNACRFSLGSPLPCVSAATCANASSASSPNECRIAWDPAASSCSRSARSPLLPDLWRSDCCGLRKGTRSRSLP